MTLENTLLERLSEWRPQGGRQELLVTADGWAAAVTADRCDEVGCLVWEVNLRRDGSAGVDVKSWASAVAQRVTGLLEPLKIVEIDETRKEAQLRSETPTQRGDKRFYYELLLRGNATALLRRYQAREQTPFALTNEVLARVTADVTASV